MKNMRTSLLVLGAALLMFSCSDDTVILSSSNWSEIPDSSSEESTIPTPYSSSLKTESSVSALSSSSSDDNTPISEQSSSSRNETLSSSTQYSSSLTGTLLSSANSSNSAPSSSSDDGKSSSSVTPIVSSSKPIITYSLTDVAIEHNNGCVETLGGVVTISCGGTYEFSGSNNDGQIVINTSAEDSVVHIRLNNLNLKSASDAPFFVISSSKTIIKAIEGSFNTFEDAPTRSAVTYQKKGKDKLKTDTTGACVYAKDDLTINGKGTLKIVANYKNGIHTSNDLRIRDNPTIDVHAPNNALKGKGSVDIEGGTIVLKAIDGAGIKSDEGEDENRFVEEKGSVWIKGGKIRIRSGDNGIEAYNEIVVSDEVSIPEITINTLEKGVKAASVKMGNAVTTVTSDGDGWKVTDRLEVSAGFHYMNTGSDGIDVKNAFLQTGGVIVIENISEKESSSIIASDSKISANGGTLLGFGKNSKSGFTHNMTFKSGTYYGTAAGAFTPSFSGSVIVTGQDNIDVSEQDVSAWQKVCFPQGSTNCYYYK